MSIFIKEDVERINQENSLAGTRENVYKFTVFS